MKKTHIVVVSLFSFLLTASIVQALGYFYYDVTSNEFVIDGGLKVIALERITSPDNKSLVLQHRPNQRIEFKGDNGNGFFFKQNGTVSELQLLNASDFIVRDGGGAERMKINNGGIYGVFRGTYNGGGISASGNISATGNISASGNITGDSLSANTLKVSGKTQLDINNNKVFFDRGEGETFMPSISKSKYLYGVNLNSVSQVNVIMDTDNVNPAKSAPLSNLFYSDGFRVYKHSEDDRNLVFSVTPGFDNAIHLRSQANEAEAKTLLSRLKNDDTGNTAAYNMIIAMKDNDIIFYYVDRFNQIRKGTLTGTVLCSIGDNGCQ